MAKPPPKTKTKKASRRSLLPTNGLAVPAFSAASASLAHPPGSDIGAVPFALILDHAEAKSVTAYANAANRTARERASAKFTAILRLRPFWTGRTEGSATSDVVEQWKTSLTKRKALVRTGEGEPRKYALGTAESDVVILKSFANDFKKQFRLRGKLTLKATRTVKKDANWYERSDIALMFWVLRGCCWNGKRWRVDENDERIYTRGYAFTEGERRRWNGIAWETFQVDERDVPRGERLNVNNWMIRLILLGLYSGTTQACAEELMWAGSPKGDQSYVDLDTVIAGRTGFIYRLGRHAAPGAMAGVPVKMTERLTAYMRRWREHDRAAGYTHVLHRIPDDPECDREPALGMAEGYQKIIKKVFERGGLKPLEHRKLVDTGAVWAIRSGRRKVGKELDMFKPSRSIMRSTAFLIGRSYATFVKRYGHLAPAYMRKQLKALQSLPDTVT